MHYVLKNLRPPVEHDENAPMARSSTHIIGVHTRRGGPPDRGTVAQPLEFLISLAEEEAGGASDAA